MHYFGYLIVATVCIVRSHPLPMLQTPVAPPSIMHEIYQAIFRTNPKIKKSISPSRSLATISGQFDPDDLETILEKHDFSSDTLADFKAHAKLNEMVVELKEGASFKEVATAVEVLRKKWGQKETWDKPVELVPGEPSIPQAQVPDEPVVSKKVHWNPQVHVRLQVPSSSYPKIKWQKLSDVVRNRLLTRNELAVNKMLHKDLLDRIRRNEIKDESDMDRRLVRSLDSFDWDTSSEQSPVQKRIPKRLKTKGARTKEEQILDRDAVKWMSESHDDLGLDKIEK